jgi:predicted metal-dependent hydrolase
MSWLDWLLTRQSKSVSSQSKARMDKQPAALDATRSATKRSTALITQESIVLADAALSYKLIRKPRRNVGLRIDTDGLTVNAAMGTPATIIESFIRKHEKWILKKLDVWKSREVKPMQWEAQTPLMLRGQTIQLFWDRTKSSPVRIDLIGVTIGEPKEERIAARVQQWLKREALTDFAARTHRVCQQHAITPPRMMLSSAKHRWGSCNSKREVRLNWRLIQASPEIIEYVICHELAHLKHMDHSPRFWAEVARMCPDYDRLRKQLQDLDHQLKRL